MYKILLFVFLIILDLLFHLILLQPINLYLNTYHFNITFSQLFIGSFFLGLILSSSNRSDIDLKDSFINLTYKIFLALIVWLIMCFIYK